MLYSTMLTGMRQTTSVISELLLLCVSFIYFFLLQSLENDKHNFVSNLLAPVMCEMTTTNLESP